MMAPSEDRPALLNFGSAVFLGCFAVGLTALILWICYPGFMSYDSLRMLEEARSQVRGGVFPPMPVYVLRVFDMTGNGVPFLIATQVFTLAFCLLLLCHWLGMNNWQAAGSTTLLMAFPPVFGACLVLWKDVTFSALLLVAVVCIFAAATGRAERNSKILCGVALAALTVAALLRYNGLAAAIPLGAYWSFVFFRGIRRLAAVVAAIAIFVLSSLLVNSYGIFPIRKLDPANNWLGVMANDLVGTSYWAKQSLVPFKGKGPPEDPVPFRNIEGIYSSIGADVIGHNAKNIGVRLRIYPHESTTDDLRRAWLSAISNHTLAYLRYRFDLFQEIIGLVRGETYEPTHYAKVDPNSFGIRGPDRSVTEYTLAYIRSASHTLFGKPWLVFAISTVCVLIVVFERGVRHPTSALALATWIAAMGYIAPFFIISASGEVRYSVPSTVLCYVSIIAALSLGQTSWKRHHAHKT